ncbi:MAG: hypothetical protein J7M26_00415, partial [Armatimonadetes bacterium]|nr:hypothetical protein [Armatimonadota bacterium]
MRRSSSFLLWAIAVVALVLASYGAGRVARTHLWPTSAAWADEGAPATTLQARAERHGSGQDEIGTVFLNDKELFTVETLAGGLTGYERAMIVAKRLNDAFAAGAAPDDFTAAVVQGLNV